jgi:hypothetical protein
MTDKIQNNEIEGFDIKLGEITNLHLSVKMVGDHLMLDARKWLKYPNIDDYRPSHKGIMLDFKAWSMLIPQVQAMMESCGYKSTYKDNSLQSGKNGGEVDG